MEVNTLELISKNKQKQKKTRGFGYGCLPPYILKAREFLKHIFTTQLHQLMICEPTIPSVCRGSLKTWGWQPAVIPSIETILFSLTPFLLTPFLFLRLLFFSHLSHSLVISPGLESNAPVERQVYYHQNTESFSCAMFIWPIPKISAAANLSVYHSYFITVTPGS